MSLLADRGSVTEYILITILIGISVMFVAQRYGITLRDKTTDAGAQIDGTGVGDVDGERAGESLTASNGMANDGASGSMASADRPQAGSVGGGSATSTGGGAARSSTGARGADAGGSGSATVGGSDASGAPGSAASTSLDLTVEETGSLPESDEDAGAIDVLGFEITLSTAIWLALLVVAVGFVMVRQTAQKQKKIAKQAETAARLRKGSA